MHCIKACNSISEENTHTMLQNLCIGLMAVVWSEYAEALINPIKYISQLHKREAQLAVFLEDNCEVRRTICAALACGFANSLMSSVCSHSVCFPTVLFVVLFRPACSQPGQGGGDQERQWSPSWRWKHPLLWPAASSRRLSRHHQINSTR